MTPAELLAVLPDVDTPPPELPGFPPSEGDALAAAAARLARETAPSRADLARAARRSSRLLGAVADAMLGLSRSAAKWAYLGGTLLGCCGVVTVMALYPVLAGTTAPFGAAKIAAGTAGVAVFIPGFLALSVLAHLRVWPLLMDPSRHFLHGLSRWLDLVGGKVDSSNELLEMAQRLVPEERPGTETQPGMTKDEEHAAHHSGPSELVWHVLDDEHCPCPAPGCAGRLATLEALYFLAEAALRFAMVMAAFSIIPMITPLATKRLLWTTWWGWLIGVLTLVGGSAGCTVTVMPVQFRRPHPPMLALSRRLQHRAVSLRIGAMLRGYAELLAADQPPRSDDDGQPRPAPPSDYAALLAQLARSWATGARAQTAAAQLIVAAVLFLLPGAAANLAVGSCIPAWEAFVVAWWLTYSVTYLLEVAAANARSGAVLSAVRAGRAAALKIISASAERDASSPSPDPRHRALREALAAHADRLGAFAGNVSLTRFFGLEVTYGTARGLPVTALTVLFALWGVLRGMGVYVVFESYCYG
ncbi:hypothetical protein DFJ74DRAFT_702877 [Hyaloraphidium curvatum]|nr:hypothetical protein DFJ74DRAFT_702877 [Hyaloraphidium curvatum]